jgi:hypothetical protein
MVVAGVAGGVTGGGVTCDNAAPVIKAMTAVAVSSLFIGCSKEMPGGGRQFVNATLEAKFRRR